MRPMERELLKRVERICCANMVLARSRSLSRLDRSGGFQGARAKNACCGMLRSAVSGSLGLPPSLSR
jgi:hypothetical protein